MSDIILKRLPVELWRQVFTHSNPYDLNHHLPFVCKSFKTIIDDAAELDVKLHRRRDADGVVKAIPITDSTIVCLNPVLANAPHPTARRVDTDPHKAGGHRLRSVGSLGYKLHHDLPLEFANEQLTYPPTFRLRLTPNLGGRGEVEELRATGGVTLRIYLDFIKRHVELPSFEHDVDFCLFAKRFNFVGYALQMGRKAKQQTLDNPGDFSAKDLMQGEVGIHLVEIDPRKDNGQRLAPYRLRLLCKMDGFIFR